VVGQILVSHDTGLHTNKQGEEGDISIRLQSLAGRDTDVTFGLMSSLTPGITLTASAPVQHQLVDHSLHLAVAVTAPAGPRPLPIFFDAFKGRQRKLSRHRSDRNRWPVPRRFNSLGTCVAGGHFDQRGG
jgi:hypothetical protein